MIAVSVADNVVLTRAIEHLMWSRKRADCRPGRFRLQAVTTTLLMGYLIILSGEDLYTLSIYYSLMN